MCNCNNNCNCEVTPEYYYILAVAGGGNAQGYGEAMPQLGIDFQDSRIKQLGRFTDDVETSTITVDSYNELIPATSTLHGVLDVRNNNHANQLDVFQKGLVSSAQYVAQKLLDNLPENAGILIVDCSRAGSAFGSNAALGSYKLQCGADAASERWDVGAPLYLDLRDRIRYALDLDVKNQMLAVIWNNGETDAQDGTQAEEYGTKLAELIDALYVDINQTHANQCVSGDSSGVALVIGSGTQHVLSDDYDLIKHSEVQIALERDPVRYVDLTVADNGGYIESNAEDALADGRLPDSNLYFSSGSLRTVVAQRYADAIRAITELPWISDPIRSTKQEQARIDSYAVSEMLKRGAIALFTAECPIENTNILTVGEKVDTLLDHSVCKHEARQHVDARRPVITPSALQDNKHYMEFDNAQRLVTNVDLNKPFASVVVLVRLNSTPSPFGTSNGIVGNDNGAWDQFIYFINGQLAIGGSTTQPHPVPVVAGHNPAVAGEWHVISVHWYDGTNKGRVYCNGKCILTFNKSNSVGTDKMVIGSVHEVGLVNLDGDLAEVSVFDKELDDLQIRTLHEGIRQKWNIDTWNPVDLID